MPIASTILTSPVLPKGSKIIKSAGHGSSLWSQAGKIAVLLPDGTTEHYFIKFTETQVAKFRSLGEFESLKWLHKAIPDNVPRPIGWGTLAADPEAHFVMSSFMEIHDEQCPRMPDFCKLIADLHVKSRELCPNGMFGFPVPTYNGLGSYYTKWTPSWEAFFTKFLAHLLEQERARAGPCAALEALSAALFEKVIPRLLRPLETGGNDIRPTLIHGDLFHGNTACHVSDGSPRIFDPGCFFGHHEFQFYNWRAGSGRYLFDHDWVREVFKHDPPSEPRDEWPDRNELYALNASLQCSIHWPKVDRYRDETMQIMRRLVERYPDGYTGPYGRKGSESGAAHGENELITASTP